MCCSSSAVGPLLVVSENLVGASDAVLHPVFCSSLFKHNNKCKGGWWRRGGTTERSSGTSVSIAHSLYMCLLSRVCPCHRWRSASGCVLTDAVQQSQRHVINAVENVTKEVNEMRNVQCVQEFVNKYTLCLVCSASG